MGLIKTSAEIAKAKYGSGMGVKSNVPTKTSVSKSSTSGSVGSAGGSNEPMRKYARAVISQGNADFYQPLVEESTLMLPTKSREIFQWCRHFYRSDSLVSAAVNFHSEFAINGFRNVCEDTKMQKYFYECAIDIIKLPQLLSFICLEWYKLGNCFKKDTKITTSQGLINIQDIKTDDLVLTHKNNIKKVTNIMQRDVDEKIYYIQIDTVKNKLACTGEHPILCLRDDIEVWVKAKDITLYDKVKVGRIDRELYKEDLFLRVIFIEYETEQTTVYNFSVEED